MKLHHFGYAVKSIQDFIDRMPKSIYGDKPISEIFFDPIQKVSVAFIELEKSIFLELIQPEGDDSPVNSILMRQGEGVYHSCYSVENLEAHIEALRKETALMIVPPTPAVAFGNRKVCFFLTKNKEIIELVEEQ